VSILILLVRATMTCPPWKDREALSQHTVSFPRPQSNLGHTAEPRSQKQRWQVYVGQNWHFKTVQF